jgi:hypothetical protein
MSGLISELDSLIMHLVFDLFLSLSLLKSIFGSSESSRSLLVHLSSWGDSIYCHIESAGWLDDRHQLIDVFEYVIEDLTFRLRLGSIRWMEAWMDDTIHVEEEIVEFGVSVLYLLFDELLNHPVLIPVVETDFVWVILVGSELSVHVLELVL